MGGEELKKILKDLYDNFGVTEVYLQKGGKPIATAITADGQVIDLIHMTSDTDENNTEAS